MKTEITECSIGRDGISLIGRGALSHFVDILSFPLGGVALTLYNGHIDHDEAVSLGRDLRLTAAANEGRPFDFALLVGKSTDWKIHCWMWPVDHQHARNAQRLFDNYWPSTLREGKDFRRLSVARGRNENNQICVALEELDDEGVLADWHIMEGIN